MLFDKLSVQDNLGKAFLTVLEPYLHLKTQNLVQNWFKQTPMILIINLLYWDIYNQGLTLYSKVEINALNVLS